MVKTELSLTDVRSFFGTLDRVTTSGSENRLPETPFSSSNYFNNYGLQHETKKKPWTDLSVACMEHLMI
jgi:hypothetical protein